MNFPLTGMSRRFSIYFIHDLKQKKRSKLVFRRNSATRCMEQNGNKKVKQKQYITLFRASINPRKGVPFKSGWVC